jgi:hypothetical protein
MIAKLKYNLRDNETISFVVRPSHLNYFWSYTLALALLFSASFFAFWLIFQGWFGMAVLISCAMASLGLIFRARAKTRQNYWVLTNQRLMDIERHGFFKETISNVELNQITDSHIRRRGLGSYLFGLGDLIIDAGNEEYAVSIGGIKDPQIILDNIIKLANIFESADCVQDHKLVIKNLYKILYLLTIDEMKELINRLKNRLIEKEEEDIL